MVYDELSNGREYGEVIVVSCLRSRVMSPAYRY